MLMRWLWWKGRKTFNNPEGFEFGTRGWYPSRGAWQVGIPESGPGVAYEGTMCAGTVLDGNYPNHTDSRLITPEMTLPGFSQLRFYQWFSLSSGDTATVEISVNGGEWQPL